MDGWLMKLYPKAPTWKEIADVVEKIGHNNLAQSIRQVYITGEQIDLKWHKYRKQATFGKRKFCKSCYICYCVGGLET